MSLRLLTIHVWMVATVVPLLVRLLPLRRLLRLLTPVCGIAPYRGIDAQAISAAVRHRLSSPRNMRRRACLREGVTLFHFLRLAGLPAELRFGVYPKSGGRGRMHGHCWVTIGSQCVTSPAETPSALVLVYPGEVPPGGF